MAKQKFYAVKKGRDTGIFCTWEECRRQVQGYSGASYKSFGTKEEAMAYLGNAGCQGVQADAPPARDKAEFSEDGIRCTEGKAEFSEDGIRCTEGKAEFSEDGIRCTGGKAEFSEDGIRCTGRKAEFSEDGIRCTEGKAEFSEDGIRCTGGKAEFYVDGSYCAETGEFSYGMVVLHGGAEYRFSEKMSDAELAQMHNVAGEIKGAEAAMRYAMEHGMAHIVIYHDYEGIAKWCTGEWKANKPGTQAYRDYYRAAREKVGIAFQKVRGHSHNKYNDIADGLAKQALGIR